MKIAFLLCWSLLANDIKGQATVEPYPDNSLHIEQYMSFGMPEPDTLWNAAEYKRAKKVIQGFYKVDKWSLPRKGSQFSGSLFERMTMIENLDVIVNQDKPIQDRLKEHDDIINSINQILQLYYEHNETEQRFGTEVLTLVAFSAKSSTYTLEIIKELQALVNDNNKNSMVNVAYEQLIESLAVTMEEHFEIIGANYKSYNQKDIEDFTKETTTWSINMLPYLDKTQLKNLTLQVKNISKNHPNQKVKQDFKLLLKALNKSSKNNDF